MNKRFTDVWCSETGHIGFTENGVDKKFTGSEFEEYLNNLTAEELESIPKSEVCEPEEEPKLNSYIDYSANEMCRAMAEQLEFVEQGSLFIIFGMGSIRLDISNPDNFLSITRDYIEIFNADNKELTFIKIDDLTGFVFEPPVECDCEDDECTCNEE